MNFFIPGSPRSTQTGSVIRIKGRAFPVRRGTAWSSYCAFVAKEHAPDKPLEGPICVRLCFFLKRPKKPKYHYPIGRPDAENLGKGICDKFNGIVWNDDSQIIDISFGKRYTDADHPEGVWVNVSTELVG
jgi:Holliday junction resolvase RusA-like endonuclease